MSILQWIFWVAFAVCVSFCTGFFIGWAYRASRDKSLVTRVRVLENFKKAAEVLCPKLTSGENKNGEEKGDYLPKDIPSIKFKSVKPTKKEMEFVDSRPTRYLVEKINHGNPRDF